MPRANFGGSVYVRGYTAAPLMVKECDAKTQNMSKTPQRPRYQGILRPCFAKLLNNSTQPQPQTKRQPNPNQMETDVNNVLPGILYQGINN